MSSSRQLKLECLKQAVIATNAYGSKGREIEVMRIARIMFAWVKELPKEEGDEE